MRALTVAAAAGGTGLAGATRLLSAVRTPDKPLHPTGSVVGARLHRFGATPATGVPWLDGTGTAEAVVRLSRAVGLPSWCPDVFGLAIRLDLSGRRGDLLFATTGWSPLTRFLLRPGRGARGPMTTLLPYRCEHGPVLLGARRIRADAYELSCALGTGPWRPFAELELEQTPPEPDAPIAFDPLLNTIPGLQPYDWVRRLREPAYATARSHRDRATSPR